MNNILENNKNTESKELENEFFHTPNVDIFEKEDKINLITELPGVEEASLELIVEDNVLTISGKMKDQSFDAYDLVYSEYKPASYKRSFTINNEFDKDKLKAVFKNGVLDISIPKVEKVAPKKIKIDLL